MLDSNVIANHHSAAADIYTDFSGLNRLKNLAAKDGKAALEEVAQQFESIFLNIALKSMRQANEAFARDSYFNSNQSRMYQDMLDQQLSVTLSRGDGLGLADTLVRQMAKYVRDAESPAHKLNSANTADSSISNDIAIGRYQDVSRTAGLEN